MGLRLGRCNVGEVAGPPAISPSKIILGAAASPLFPPLDQALIHAMACEVVAETEVPLSRQSLADLVQPSRNDVGQEDQPQHGVADVARSSHQAVAV